MSTTTRFFAYLLLLLSAAGAYAQFPATQANQFLGTVGPTWINGQPYYSVRLRPDFPIGGNIGVGLDLNFDFDSQGKLRTENFNEASDYISIIRYLRYGTEVDPVFAKLGALDYVTLGHGSIINQYNNSPSFDARKTGMQFNINSDRFGVQTLYGNFGQAGIAGVRGFIRPLQFSSLTDIPIISNIEVGATYAMDFDKYARVDSVNLLTLEPARTNGALSIVGADIAFPILRNAITSIDLYSDYTKILSFGSGVATGAIFRFDFSQLVKVRSRLERRFNGEHYIASYFDAMYEIERFSNGRSKYMALTSPAINSNGYYGDLLLQLIGTFDVLGSFQKLDMDPNSGILHLTTEVSPTGTPYVARAGYDKIGIQDFTDLITTDERSYLYAEGGYKPLPYLLVSVRYSWTFTPMRDADNNIIRYEPQRKIEPRITLVYQLAQ